MLLRRRSLVVLIAVALAALALAAGAVLGLRTTGGLRQAPAAALLAPRSARAPALALAVLAAGSRPAWLGASWTRAAADGRVRLAELRGRPVVLNFWASWCDACRLEAPLLERAWRAHRGAVLLLGIDQDDARSDALGFLRRFSVSYPSLYENGYATSLRWGARGLPVTYFLAADGRVVAQAIGRLRPSQLRRGVAAARAGRLAT